MPDVDAAGPARNQRDNAAAIYECINTTANRNESHHGSLRPGSRHVSFVHVQPHRLSYQVLGSQAPEDSFTLHPIIVAVAYGVYRGDGR